MSESLRERPVRRTLGISHIFFGFVCLEITGVLELGDRNDGGVNLVSVHFRAGHG